MLKVTNFKILKVITNPKVGLNSKPYNLLTLNPKPYHDTINTKFTLNPKTLHP